MRRAGAPRGHTGQKVEEQGTYESKQGQLWTYVTGDLFREDPATGKSTVWERTSELEHPGETR